MIGLQLWCAIERFHFLNDAFQVVRQKVDVVADEEGRGGEAGHDFGVEAFLVMIEEDVVAVATLVEMVHDVIHGNLDEICESIRIVTFPGEDVEFPEADAGAGGGIEGNIVFLHDRDAFEFLGGEEEGRIEIREANELHVGMPDGAARHGTEILEEEDGFVFSRIDHLFPMAQTEADETMHVILRVVRHIRLAVTAFDDDELVSPLDDIVFVAKQDDIAVGVEDIRKVRHVAEGAGGFPINDVFRFLASKRHVKANEIYFHRELL